MLHVACCTRTATMQPRATPAKPVLSTPPPCAPPESAPAAAEAERCASAPHPQNGTSLCAAVATPRRRTDRDRRGCHASAVPVPVESERLACSAAAITRADAAAVEARSRRSALSALPPIIPLNPAPCRPPARAASPWPIARTQPPSKAPSKTDPADRPTGRTVVRERSGPLTRGVRRQDAPLVRPQHTGDADVASPVGCASRIVDGLVMANTVAELEALLGTARAADAERRMAAGGTAHRGRGSCVQHSRWSTSTAGTAAAGPCSTSTQSQEGVSTLSSPCSTSMQSQEGVSTLRSPAPFHSTVCNRRLR